MNEKKVVLFGAGIIGRRAYNFYQADTVFCFADNNKAGQTFLNKKVISFDELKRIHSSYHVIVTVGPALASQLKSQCYEVGIEAQIWADNITYKDYESNSEIAKYKDIYKGRRCFIVGNGPSLCVEDINKLNDYSEISFACNLINKIYPKTIWRPSYYVATDPLMFIKERFGDLLEISANVNFLPYPEDNCSGDITEVRDTIKKMKGEVYFFNKLPVTNENKILDFSPDPSRMVQVGGVAYVMIQFATYMGFTEIYLIGIDFTIGSAINADENYSAVKHFYEETDIYKKYRNIAVPNLDKASKIMFNAFISAKTYSDKHGIKIYNATRGGKLEIFNRIDFNSLFS